MGDRSALLPPTLDRRGMRRNEYDADQRALFFRRTVVYGEKGDAYYLTASSHFNSNCWVGTSAIKDPNGMPLLYTIQVFKEDPSMHGTIWREIRALTAIESKGSDENYIPVLIDQGATNSGFKFAVTTFTGKPLAMVLTQFPPPLKPSSASRVIICLTRALAFVHSAGYVHGNVSAYSVLTSNGLSSDASNIRLGGFHYSSTSSSSEQISYPLNIYTSRAVHQKKAASATTDIEGLVFLAFHLFAGLPWANAKQLKKMVAAKEKFFESVGDGKWEKVPESLRDVAEKLKDAKTIDLASLESALSPGKTDEKVAFEWEMNKVGREQDLGKPTQIAPCCFNDKKKEAKEGTKERIAALQKAVGPDR